jgi:replicative DNA helicase
LSENITLESEYGVIGSVLIDAACIPEVRAVLKPEDVSLKLHQRILKTAYGMFDAGEAIDPMTIVERLRERGEPVNDEYIIDLMNITPTAVNAVAYAENVKRSAMLRSLKEVGANMAGLSMADNPFQVMAEASAKIEEISEGTAASTISSTKMLKEFLSYRANIDKRSSSVFVRTGFENLDKILGAGLLNEGFYVLAARPGKGKTTLALAIADNIAARGEPVLFVSLEMSKNQLTAKRIAREARLDSNKILTQQLAQEEYSAVTRASSKLAVYPLEVNEKYPLTIPEIAAMAAGIKGLRIVIIDYFGLIKSAEKKESRVVERTEMSSAIKNMARRLGVPILCLSQLNRENEKRGNKRPQLSDLRETGAIEQDADGVIFLNSNDYDNGPGYDPYGAAELEVIVAKNRHGGTGITKMAFYRATSIITPARSVN